MEIQTKVLRDALELVAPAVPRKPTLPALCYARLGRGRAVVSDLDVAVAVALPWAEEDLLLPVRDALGFLRYAPGAKTARATSSDGQVSIAVDGMAAAFRDVPGVAAFPPLPQVTAEGEGALDGDALLRALAAVAPYASGDDTRPVLTGIYLDTSDGLMAVAADGFRMAWESIPGRLVGPAMVVPAWAVALLEHLWKRAAAPEFDGVGDIAALAAARRLIGFAWQHDWLRLTFGAVTLVIRLIEVSFPSYRQLIPGETASPFTVDAEEMARALAQVAPVAEKAKGTVRLRWAEGGTVRVSAREEDGREAEVPLRAHFAEPGRIALNSAYLQDYFKGRSGPVTVALSGGDGGPVLFTHKGRPHALIMPMIVQW